MVNKKNLYERIFNHIPANLYWNISDGRMPWTNKFARKCLGLTQEEIDNLDRRKLETERYHPEDLDVFISSYYALLDENKEYYMSMYREKDKNGKWMIPLGIINVGTRNKEEKQLDAICCSIDIAGKFEELWQLDLLLRENVFLKDKLKFNKLTKREKEVLAYIVVGMNTNEVSGKLGISIETVKAHRKHIFFKLESKNMADLVRINTLCNKS